MINCAAKGHFQLKAEGLETTAEEDRKRNGEITARRIATRTKLPAQEVITSSPKGRKTHLSDRLNFQGGRKMVCRVKKGKDQKNPKTHGDQHRWF